MMEVKRDFRNDLLKRRELELVMEADSNPGFENSKKAIVEEFKSPEENIVVKSIMGSFGSNKFSIEAFIYDSVEDKEKIELWPKSMKRES